MALSNFIPNGYEDINEAKDRRTYTSKSFSKDGKQFISSVSTGIIQYNNKLKLGDGNNDYLREIDFTLQDKDGGGWYFEYNNFLPTLPATSAGWVEFRDIFKEKDLTTKYKPVCNDVVGVKFDSLEGVTSGNGVIYADAYGAGKDYILYFIRTGLAKVVRIKEANKGTEELRFRFEVDFGGRKVFRGNSVDDISYEVDLTTNKTFDSSKKTFIQDESGEYTELMTFKCWDSSEEGNYQVISVDFIVDAGKMYLEKIIPASFITNSIGDIYTDTVSSFFSGAGDGRTRNWQSGTWATIQGAASGNFASHTETSVYCGSGIASDTFYSINRGYVPFDTSSIASTDTIDSADFKLYNNYKTVGDDDAQAYITVIQTSQASPTVLAIGDYDQCGDTIDNPTEGTDTRWKLGSGATGDAITASAYNTFTLNTAGLGWVARSGESKGSGTGYTSLGIREGHDAEDNAYAGSTGTDNTFGASSSEATGTAQDPILEVTHTAAAADTGNMFLMF